MIELEILMFSAVFKASSTACFVKVTLSKYVELNGAAFLSI